MTVEKVKTASDSIPVDVNMGAGNTTASLVMSESFDCTQEPA